MSTTNDELRLRSVGEAAELLGVSRRALYRAAKAGKVPAVRIGRRYFFSARALRAWLDRIG